MAHIDVRLATVSGFITKIGHVYLYIHVILINFGFKYSICNYVFLAS